MAERVDEILEKIWLAQEKGEEVKLSTFQEADDEPFDAALIKSMESDGLITIEGNSITFTPQGRQRATGILRRHRLAERLMKDVLEMKDSLETESAACQFEHMLPAEVTECICTLLGHPTTCPHGHPIPPGECCRRAIEEVRPVVIPLSKMKTGSEGTVAYVATQHHRRLDKLATFGLLPGVKIRLHQRQPSFVVQIGETTIAIDEETAADIYVRQPMG